MFFRVILAAIIGGALAFVGGFVGHGVLHLTERHMKEPSDVSGLKESFGKHFTDGAIHYFPLPKMNDPKLTEQEREAAKTKFNEEYKAGPSALVVAGPRNEEFNFIKVLCMEGATNVIAAFIAAMIVAMTRPGLGFVVRWSFVVLMGVFTWVCVNASYHIWWHFPFPFVLDELYCALIEWGLAGIAIAAIVNPKERVMGY